jgi:hypothetical protein
MKKCVGTSKLLRGIAAFAMVAVGGQAYAQTADRPLTANAGNVDPFAGNVDPFKGNLDPFSGNVDPFGGNVDPFSGNVDPFGGNVDPFRGNVDPFGGNVDPFHQDGKPLTSAQLGAHWQQFGSNWRTLAASWDALATMPTDTAKRNAVLTQFQTLVSQSESFWAAQVTRKNGKSFNDAVLQPLLTKYSLNKADATSFANMSATNRAKFVFEFYDTLQSYAGIDHVDHWMRTVRWNPNLTKVQGSGTDSLIGIIDGRITGDADLQNNLDVSLGYKGTAGGHGAAVLSLIVAEHDKKGVQGIAPKARVLSYNPFDKTGTASWADITKGVQQLAYYRYASVVNLSLGAKGYALHPDWKTVFSDSLVKVASNYAVYVIAAGNDGVSQTQNVDWTGVGNASLILVGSINNNGSISSFSNRPGTACLTVSGVCTAGNRLQDRFVVAPGELLLVSNGSGGTTRVTGTSFSAPLVSGAITLLHDRWPWLAKYPRESADIILSTARDLGAPGTDPVYGRGLLDVEASQSPINFANLTYYRKDGTSSALTQVSVADVKAAGLSAAFQNSGAYYVAYEKIGNTDRDFLIPLSTRLIGQQTSINGSQEYFQDYVTSRLDDWIGFNEKGALTDTVAISSNLSSGLKLSFAMAPVKQSDRQARNGLRSSSPNVRVSSANGKLGLSFGHGNGSRIIGGQQGFGFASDYDASNGGVNPILGFASGGAFAGADLAVNENMSVSVGFTQNSLSENRTRTSAIAALRTLGSQPDYKANAFSLQMAQKFGKVTVTANFAQIDENNALLGVQSREESDLGKGSVSKTATLGAAVALPGKVSLAASATLGQTKSAKAENQALVTSGKGLTSSAFALSASKAGVLGKRDLIRLSVSQPLTIEKGDVSFSTLAVVDRQTGARGVTTQTFSLADKDRRLVGEMVYAMPLMKSGELSLFGRADYRLNAENGRKVDGMVIGGRVSLPF